MKKEWIFLLIIFLQFSCIGKNNHNNEENALVDSMYSDVIIEETDDNDTSSTKFESNIGFLYTEISKSEYERLKECFRMETISSIWRKNINYCRSPNG